MLQTRKQQVIIVSNETDYVLSLTNEQLNDGEEIEQLIVKDLVEKHTKFIRSNEVSWSRCSNLLDRLGRGASYYWNIYYIFYGTLTGYSGLAYSTTNTYIRIYAECCKCTGLSYHYFIQPIFYIYIFVQIMTGMSRFLDLLSIRKKPDGQ